MRTGVAYAAPGSRPVRRQASQNLCCLLPIKLSTILLAVSDEEQQSWRALNRRRFIQAGVAGTAAAATWTAPTILSLDRAVAGASCALTGTLNWNTIGVGNPFTSTTLAASGPYPALTISLANTTVGTPTAVTGNQLVQLTPNPYGGQASPFYKYFMNNNAANEGYTGTFTFSSPVWNLQFTIFDIDRNLAAAPATGFQDKVYLTSSAAFTFTQPAGGLPTGVGTSGNPWVGTTNTAVPDNSNLGNVSVTFAGPISSFSMTFLSGNLLNRQQSVGISNLTFCR